MKPSLEKILFYLKFHFLFFTTKGFTKNAVYPFVDASLDISVDSSNNPCTDLTAIFLPLGNSDSYEVTSITDAHPSAFSGVTNLVLSGIDDQWSSIINLPFHFCFFGNNQNQIQSV